MSMEVTNGVSASLNANATFEEKQAKTVAIIYDRLNYLTLGTVIALVKKYTDKVYIANVSDPRISYIAISLGAEIISTYGDEKDSILNKVHVDNFEGIFVLMYGDGSHSPDRIPMMIDQIKNGYDVAVDSSSTHSFSPVNENVLYLNNKTLNNSYSGFIACSSRCLDQIYLDSQSSNGTMGSAKQIYGYAKSKGLRIKQLDANDAKIEMLSLYRIGVVVPAYNEERLIGQTILSVPWYISKIYVIDDCSKDRTPEVIKSIPDRRVVNIRHEVNKGVGAAIITGYKRALEDEMDMVAIMAGDNQMDPEQLPRLLMPIADGKADYTKGNRLMSKNLRKGMSTWRSAGNFMLTMVTKIGSGYWQIADPQNGYTAISRQALESIDLDSVYTYYGYCNDLLIKLNAFGMRTMDIVMPARYGEEKSHIKYGRYIIKVAPMIFRGFLWRLKTKYIMLDFNPLVLFYLSSMIMIPAGLILSLWMLIRHFQGYEVPSIYPIFMLFMLLTGIQFLLFAMMLDMQDNKNKNTNTN